MPPTIYKRCLHVVSENHRVLEGAKYLIDGDVEPLRRSDARIASQSARSVRSELPGTRHHGGNCRIAGRILRRTDDRRRIRRMHREPGEDRGCAKDSPHRSRSDIRRRLESSPTFTSVPPPMAPAPARLTRRICISSMPVKSSVTAKIAENLRKVRQKLFRKFSDRPASNPATPGESELCSRRATRLLFG